MKILVDNYLNNEHTQPLYFYESLRSIEGIESYYWPNEGSAYDTFDDIKPDIFISSINCSYEKVHYVQRSNMSHVINTDGGEVHPNFKKAFGDKTTYISFVSNPNSLRIMHCADTNLLKSEDNLTFNIPTAYFITKDSEVNDKHSYHKISCTYEKTDIMLPEYQLFSLYRHYDKIIFRDIENFSQSFFDAIITCDNVYYENSDDSLDELSKKIFKQVLNIKNKENVDAKSVREHVLKNHTCNNRTKSLLSQLPINQNLFAEVGADK